jgi:hypothetical protein
MFTVVIPTMWKAETFEEELNSICSSSFVDDIIIINNYKEKTPDWNLLSYYKVLMVTPPENIIVNPSWNLGVRLAKNNNICLLNDDLIFDTTIFNFMNDHLDKNLCGLQMSNIESPIRLSISENRCLGFGCMMFIRKDTYEFIPNTLRLFFGDDYLFRVNKLKGNEVYYIEGCFNNQIWGVTSKQGVEAKSKKLLDEIGNEELELERLINEKNNFLHSK